MRIAPAAPPFAPGEILADFNYMIRGPHQIPRLGHIEARAWPANGTQLPAGTSFADAVKAAQLVASKPIDDGIHRLTLHQAQGVLQAADGSVWITPLGGFHREKDGPLFVDGRMFETTALSLQVVRRARALLAVVGAQNVLDLRATGGSTVVVEPQDATAPAA